MTDYLITISVNNEGIPPLIDVVQNDSGRNIVASVVGLDLTDKTARVYVVKPSGLDVYDYAQISGDTVTVSLTQQMLAEVGNTKMQISIYDSTTEERVSSFVIWLNVEESLQDNGLINSSSEYRILDDLINSVAPAVEGAENALEDATEAVTQAETALTNASTAVNNANAATTNANNAASAANTATTNANNATNAANSAAASATSAADAANTAATEANEAAEVIDTFQEQIDGKLDKAGGTVTGDLTVDGTISVDGNGIVTTTTKSLTYYVDATNGNDSNDGLTTNTAFKTIQHAIDMLPKFLNHNITIQLARDIYNESVSIHRLSGASLTIKGSDTLDEATNYKINSLGIYLCLNQTTMQGITATYVGGNNGGFECTGQGLKRFINCQIMNSGNYGFYAVYGAKVYISSCSVQNRTCAVHLSTCSNCCVNNITGSDNDIGVRSIAGSTLHLGSDLPANFAKTTVASKSNGGVIFNPNGTLYVI